MPFKNKSPKNPAVKLISLSAGAVILGCIIPLVASLDNSGTARVYLVAMEALGAAVLTYVFGLYLLKK